MRNYMTGKFCISRATMSFALLFKSSMNCAKCHLINIFHRHVSRLENGVSDADSLIKFCANSLWVVGNSSADESKAKLVAIDKARARSCGDLISAVVKFLFCLLTFMVGKKIARHRRWAHANFIFGRRVEHKSVQQIREHFFWTTVYCWLFGDHFES